MNVQEIIRAELASFFKKHAPEEAPEPEGATTEKDNVELDTKTPLTAALRAAGIETVEQLSAMQDLLNEDFQKQVDGYLAEIGQMSAEFKKPVGMRNKTVMESQIRSLDRRVKDGLAVDKVRDHLVSM